MELDIILTDRSVNIDTEIISEAPTAKAGTKKLRTCLATRRLDAVVKPPSG
jgi:hypothetical protein